MRAANWRPPVIASALLMISLLDARAGDQLVLHAIRPPNAFDIEVYVDGAPLDKRWDDYFARLFSFLDHNADDRLDRAEAGRAPAPLLVLDHLRGDFDNLPAETVAWEDLQGQQATDRVSVAKLADYYRRRGLGRIELKRLQLQDDTADRVAAAILTEIGDRRGLSLASIGIDRAAALLRRLDSDGDQRLSVAELLVTPAVTAVQSPGTLVNQPLAAIAPSAGHANSGLVVRLASTDSLVQELEARGELFGKVQSQQPPSEQIPSSVIAEQRPGAIISLAVRPSSAVATFAAARESLAQEFETADQDRSRSLDNHEASESFSPDKWRVLTKIADADADKKLSSVELNRYLDLQASAAAQQAVVTVADTGPALLATLDRDKDGRLSLRELIAAWTTRDPAGEATGLASWDINRDGRITRDEIPRRLEVTFSIGPPRRLPAPSIDAHPPSPRAPSWVQALDINADGDLSPREFIGRREDFQALDHDGNGLIDPAEARAQPKI